MITIEILITFIIIIFCFAWRRIISGRKNGAFYAKGNKKITNPKIKSWVQNLHRLETPAWYFQFIPLFFITFLLIRVLIYVNMSVISYNYLILLEQFIISYIITMSISGLGYKGYQKYINIGSGVIDDDPIRTELIFKYPVLVRGKILYKEYFFYYNKFWEKWGDNTIFFISLLFLLLSFCYIYFKNF